MGAGGDQLGPFDDRSDGGLDDVCGCVGDAEQGGDRDGGRLEERSGGGGVADLLHGHRELHFGHAKAAEIFGDEQPEQAEVGELTPERTERGGVVPDGADRGDGADLGEPRTDGGAEEELVFGEQRLHG